MPKMRNAPKTRAEIGKIVDRINHALLSAEKTGAKNVLAVYKQLMQDAAQSEPQLTTGNPDRPRVRGARADMTTPELRTIVKNLRALEKRVKSERKEQAKKAREYKKQHPGASTEQAYSALGGREWFDSQWMDVRWFFDSNDERLQSEIDSFDSRDDAEEGLDTALIEDYGGMMFAQDPERALDHFMANYRGTGYFPDLGQEPGFEDAVLESDIGRELYYDNWYKIDDYVDDYARRHNGQVPGWYKGRRGS